MAAVLLLISLRGIQGAGIPTGAPFTWTDRQV